MPRLKQYGRSAMSLRKGRMTSAKSRGLTALADAKIFANRAARRLEPGRRSMNVGRIRLGARAAGAHTRQRRRDRRGRFA